MIIKIKKLHPNAVIPKYSYENDAGLDIHAISKKETDKYVEYGTGLGFEIPEGYVCLIFPRSSISNKDIIQSNCVGILDSNYRGELILRFKKLGKEDYNIGDKIGQIVIFHYPNIEFEEINELSKTQRGTKGFGSSGI